MEPGGGGGTGLLIVNNKQRSAGLGLTPPPGGKGRELNRNQRKDSEVRPAGPTLERGGAGVALPGRLLCLRWQA